MVQELKNEKTNKVFNRLRAQLYNTIEQMGFDEAQCKAYKQTVRDITSVAWNSVTSIIEKIEEEKE